MLYLRKKKLKPLALVVLEIPKKDWT